MKTEKKIENFISDYSWNNLQGNDTWSNNFFECALKGSEIAKKEIKQIVLDLKNKYKSQHREETIPKLGRTINAQKEFIFNIRMELLQELESKLC